MLGRTAGCRAKLETEAIGTGPCQITSARHRCMGLLRRLNRRQAEVPASPGSDRHSKLVQRHGQPPVHRFLDRQLMVASAEVLDEGMTAMTTLAL